MFGIQQVILHSMYPIAINYMNLTFKLFLEIKLDKNRNQTLYLINRKWIEKLKRHLGYTSFLYGTFRPDLEEVLSSISNSSLIYNSHLIKVGKTNDPILRRDILKNKEVMIISELCWNELADRFKGGPPIKFKPNCKMEVLDLKSLLFRGIIIKVFSKKFTEKFREIYFNGNESVHLLYSKICELIDSDNIDIWKSKYRTDIPAKKIFYHLDSIDYMQNLNISSLFNLITDQFNNNIKIQDLFKDGDVLIVDLKNEQIFNEDNSLEENFYQEIIDELNSKGFTNESYDINSEYTAVRILSSGLIDNNFPQYVDVMNENTLEFINSKVDNYLDKIEKENDQNADVYKHYEEIKNEFKTIQYLKSYKSMPPKGIANIGSLCYINSALQCLFSVDIFFKYFILKNYLSHINSNNERKTNGKICEALNEFMNCFFTSKYLRESGEEMMSDRQLLLSRILGVEIEDSDENLYMKNVAISPIFLFKQNVCKYLTEFNDTSMHDVSDFLLQFLDILHEEIKFTKEGNDSFIKRLFWGEFQQILTCLDCKVKSSNIQPFNILELHLNHDEFINYNNSNNLYDPNRFCKLRIKYYHYNLNYNCNNVIIDYIKNKSVGELRKIISNLFNVKYDGFNMFLIKNDNDDITIKKILLDNEKFTSILSNHNNDIIDIYIYELSPEFNIKIDDKIDINYRYLIENKNNQINYLKSELKKLYSSNDNYDNKQDCLLLNSNLKNKIRVLVNNEFFTEERIFKKRTIPLILYFNLNNTLQDIYIEIINIFLGLLNKVEKEFNLLGSDYLNEKYINQDSQKILDNPYVNYRQLLESEMPFIIYYKKNQNEKAVQLKPDNTVNLSSFNVGEMEINLRFKSKYYKELLKFYSSNDKPEIYYDYFIPRNLNNNNSNYNNNNKNNKIKIEDCLDSYFSSAIIEKKCPSCNKNQSKMNNLIKILPNILLILFKRFDNRNNKNYEFVEFPVENLDLYKYVINENYDLQDCQYNLLSVCNHSGTTEIGHYLSYCKRENEWFLFNDEKEPSKIKKDDLYNELITNDAYLLIYKKQSMDKYELNDFIK